MENPVLYLYQAKIEVRDVSSFVCTFLMCWAVHSKDTVYVNDLHMQQQFMVDICYTTLSYE